MEALAIQTDNTVQGKQMWSVIALYASIVIGWIAYEQYQPKLLVQFKFTEFTFLLTVAQAIILVLTPPIAGRLGDHYRLEKGNRIAVITTGMSFASMVFMAVAFTLLSNPGEVFRWMLPLLIVLWLVSMSIFTSPALSIIETFIPADKLPKAVALLTIVSNLLYALEPVIADIIDFLGAPITFIAGGMMVFLSGYALKKNSMEIFARNNGQEPAPEAKGVERSNFPYIILFGAVSGLATAVLFSILPDILQPKLNNLIGDVDGKFILMGTLILSAFLALPFSNKVNSYGLLRSFWVSSLFVAIAAIGIIFIQGAIVVMVLLIVFAASFSALSVSSLPLAFQKSSFKQKVFCIGIFFSASALPEGILECLSY